MNDDNLIPLNKRTKREQREITSKGGKASAKKRRERKTLKENLELALMLNSKEGKTTSLQDLSSVSEETIEASNLNMEELIALQLVIKASNGNLRAIEMIRDQLGEKPIEKTEVDMSVNVNPFQGMTTEELREIVENDRIRKAKKKKQN